VLSNILFPRESPATHIHPDTPKFSSLGYFWLKSFSIVDIHACAGKMSGAQLGAFGIASPEGFVTMSFPRRSGSTELAILGNAANTTGEEKWD
jgi:hypothetical protein